MDANIQSMQQDRRRVYCSSQKNPSIWLLLVIVCRNDRGVYAIGEKPTQKYVKNRKAVSGVVGSGE
ncbi:MAG: hypothetical protein NWF00_08135 [Candidatus Bathyarchaeota archaeon]|nr:hypothetical protein [Candidatus Bathyarchaeota archaeon]